MKSKKKITSIIKKIIEKLNDYKDLFESFKNNEITYIELREELKRYDKFLNKIREKFKKVKLKFIYYIVLRIITLHNRIKYNKIKIEREFNKKYYSDIENDKKRFEILKDYINSIELSINSLKRFFVKIKENKSIREALEDVIKVIKTLGYLYLSFYIYCKYKREKKRSIKYIVQSFGVWANPELCLKNIKWIRYLASKLAKEEGKSVSFVFARIKNALKSASKLGVPSWYCCVAQLIKPKKWSKSGKKPFKLNEAKRLCTYLYKKAVGIYPREWETLLKKNKKK